MAKTKISEFSANPANNTDIDSINIAEGCAPSGINDAIRELMAQLKDFQTGAVGDSFNGPVGTTTAAAGAFTTLTTSGNAVISTTDNSNAALRITQLGTGNALLVEDETNPDSSPFVVTADGRVILGTTEAAATYGATTPFMQVRGTDGSTSAASIESNSTTATRGGTLFLTRSRGTTVGSTTIVADDDRLASIIGSGADGSAFVQAARIDFEVDGTPGTNDMPGRIVFSTTADGASSPTERVRINSSGNVGIGTSSPAAELDIAGSNTGLTGTDANNTLRFTDTDTSTATNQPLGKIEWYSADATVSARVGAYILATAQGTSGGGNLEFGTATNTGTATEQMQITGAGELQFNSGYGSVAAAYGCRAWVNFNGTGTPAIRESGNVSSITDNGTGDYTVNFTTAMPDVNYSFVGGGQIDTSAADGNRLTVSARRASGNIAVGSLRVVTGGASVSTTLDPTVVTVAIFR